jgi:hypothetical protein
MTLVFPQHSRQKLSDEDKMRNEVDLEELFALCIACLYMLLALCDCTIDVALTSSTVFPVPIPALLINTVASPCL